MECAFVEQLCSRSRITVAADVSICQMSPGFIALTGLLLPEKNRRSTLPAMFELQWEDHSSRLSKGPTIALIPAGGALWDDFLDSIGVSLDKFCSEGPGGWQRGYINALLLCGLRTVLIFFSARITSPLRYRHTPSGTTIVVLPAPAAY